jgi:1,4-dihydroxy-2-naphthoate polyprenyltransferase
MKGDRLKAWIQASRPPFFVATLIPLVIGWIMAWSGGFHIARFLLVVLACFMVHLATNLANDYFDYREGTDAGDSIGGSRVIQEGKILPHSLIKAILLLYGLACIAAFYLMISLDLLMLLPVVLFAFFSSLFYVAPPIKYGYHGLGELLVGINMGPIMVVGTYWIMAGRPDYAPLEVSIPTGLMVASILYYQSLPDMETDERVGKRTLAIMLGKRGALLGFIAFFLLIYGSIVTLVVIGRLTWVSILCLLTLPLFLRVVRLVKTTDDWIQLDHYGKYVRLLYFVNGCAIIAGLLF